MNQAAAVETRATLDDLARHDGKAELIAGKVVPLMATGYRPDRVAAQVFRSLDGYATETGRGVAFTGNIGFVLHELRSGRQSFSPDASYYAGPLPKNPMDFITGPPTLAVEVRSKGDYGPAAEAEQAAKRADYFEAGTLTVWDVDPEAEVIHAYPAADPARPATYRRGQTADAGPAVPGWRVAVDRIFD